MNLAIAANTSSAYTSALRSYLHFCTIHDFDIAPTPDTFSLFISYIASTVKPQTVTAYLSGICHYLEQDFPNVREVRMSPIVVRTLKGASRSYGTAVNRKNALTTTDLRNLLHRGNSHAAAGNYDDVLFDTVLLTCFFGLLRLGEVASASNISPMAIIQRNSVKMSASTYEFLLPANKTDPYFQGNRIIIRRTTDDLDPLPIFQRYLALRDSFFPYHNQLFLTSSGKSPSRSWFLRIFHDVMPASYSGQSLRSGGATWLASIGTDATSIQSLGRWSSDAWKRYLREHPLLIHQL